MEFPLIPPFDDACAEMARARQGRLTKPAGSLGRLEELSVRLAGMKADPQPSIERKTVIVMAADHGVTIEGVSAYPAEVTAQMVLNFLSGGAAINVLARQAGAHVTIVDIGVAADFPGTARHTAPVLLRGQVLPAAAYRRKYRGTAPAGTESFSLKNSRAPAHESRRAPARQTI
jgi:nicotinate-nucleotide--dimethylbenzimidazole phosphoribosyltransferase